jgi:peptidoglycan/xylan/chitin deacetylase (PgdA/CDA1 family)
MHDLVTLGEILLRLSIPSPGRVETARQLDVQIGGAEANVAAAAARLGLKTAWISALPSNPWGERIRRELVGHGVDCAHVRMVDGARVGVWRLMDALTEVGIRGTVALNSEVCDVYPQIIDACMKLRWELMGHNESNTRRLNEIPAEDERRVIGSVAVRIEKATGKRPAGWLGAGLQETWSTLDHLVAEGYRYVADWVNDDQPYVMSVDGKPLVSVPYSYEINDKPAFESQHRTPEEFEAMIRRQFDVLYREGASSGRVMAICLHPYIIGVPHRIDALRSALRYVTGHQDVWLTTGAEIADHYLAWSRTAGQPR